LWFAAAEEDGLGTLGWTLLTVWVNVSYCFSVTWKRTADSEG